MTESAPALRLNAVSKSYGGLKVLSGLNLDVERNEVLGILGPNGAGKSTLFNIIAGVASATSGEIIFEGRDVAKLPPWSRCRAGIARTYQIPKPFGHMSVFENVLVACVHGGGLDVTQARRRAAAIIERTGLGRHIRLPAGAMRLLDLKRLELARALACDPKLLLLDEIAGGLTEGECDILVDLIGEIRAEGKTLIWVEHVMGALRRACSRLAVIYDGAVLTQGPPAEVLAQPEVKAIYLGEDGEA